MTPDQIGRAYDQIAHRWASEDFNRDNGIYQHQRAIAFAERRGMALDVGCGCNGRLVDLLLVAGFEPEGVDISSEMVRLARLRHPEISFHHRDICSWEPPRSYDFITAWDSIWHLSSERQARVLRKLIGALRPQGVMIFSCGGHVEQQEHTDGSMGPEMYYATLGVNGFMRLILDAGCTCRHFEFDQLPEVHSYFILQKT